MVCTVYIARQDSRDDHILETSLPSPTHGPEEETIRKNGNQRRATIWDPPKITDSEKRGKTKKDNNKKMETY